MPAATPPINHTVSIFERLYANLPPLVPQAVVEDMGRALEQVKADQELSTEELEDVMIAFGKKVWPYIQAFEEFYQVYESQLGEKLLRQRSSPALQRSYQLFKEMGGTWRDLYAGSMAHVFGHEERTELGQVLVDIKCDIRAFAFQAVTATDRAAYETRIREFARIADDISERLTALEGLAADEQEHPSLAAEIRAQIRAFEYGLAFLGPKVDYQAVCSAPEHFQGRRLELKIRV